MPEEQTDRHADIRCAYLLTSVCLCLVDLLESFENHPPIVLPSSGFRVDLDSECIEDSIYRQLLYVRHYLWGLRTKTQTHTNAPSVHTQSNGTNTADWPDVQVRKIHTYVSPAVIQVMDYCFGFGEVLHNPITKRQNLLLPINPGLHTQTETWLNHG